jgi:hypothetical protein
MLPLVELSDPPQTAMLATRSLTGCNPLYWLCTSETPYQPVGTV